MKFEFSQQISKKCTNIKFYSIGNLVVPCGQTEGRTDGKTDGQMDRET